MPPLVSFLLLLDAREGRARMLPCPPPTLTPAFQPGAAPAKEKHLPVTHLPAHSPPLSPHHLTGILPASFPVDPDELKLNTSKYKQTRCENQITVTAKIPSTLAAANISASPALLRNLPPVTPFPGKLAVYSKNCNTAESNIQ